MPDGIATGGTRDAGVRGGYWTRLADKPAWARPGGRAGGTKQADTEAQPAAAIRRNSAARAIACSASDWSLCNSASSCAASAASR